MLLSWLVGWLPPSTFGDPVATGILKVHSVVMFQGYAIDNFMFCPWQELFLEASEPELKSLGLSIYHVADLFGWLKYRLTSYILSPWGLTSFISNILHDQTSMFQKYDILKMGLIQGCQQIGSRHDETWKVSTVLLTLFFRTKLDA